MPSGPNASCTDVMSAAFSSAYASGKSRSASCVRRQNFAGRPNWNAPFFGGHELLLLQRIQCCRTAIAVTCSRPASDAESIAPSVFRSLTMRRRVLVSSPRAACRAEAMCEAVRGRVTDHF